ncbi:MAG TPA: allantoate amidohydrolase [Terriglobia bacterium]|nr:allantoate amidohydrolase [Terriglobia bacterium]
MDTVPTEDPEERSLAVAREVIARCQSLAECTEESGFTTRPFLSEPMHEVHARLRDWMEQAGMTVSVDAVGNVRGCYAARQPSAPRLFIGSHLDTVPRAGAYDGILGVVLGVALVDLLNSRRLKFHIEVVGFSEEEGLRFGVPFIGSRTFIGDIDDELLGRRDAKGITVTDAIRAFGLDPSQIGAAEAGRDALAYFEFHIEQGPVLEDLGLPLGVVEGIAGQSRFSVVFEGQANHAGTTPMHLRRDALAGAAEWISAVEQEARGTGGLVATVGRLEAEPGAGNVIPGLVRTTLDVRHADDATRKPAIERLRHHAGEIAARRGLSVYWKHLLDQAGVKMDASLSRLLERAVDASAYPVHRMTSGAGHDAMIVARRMPTAMLFLRSPGGISHHSRETVLAEDVEAALVTGMRFLDEMEARHD